MFIFPMVSGVFLAIFAGVVISVIAIALFVCLATATIVSIALACLGAIAMALVIIAPFMFARWMVFSAIAIFLLMIVILCCHFNVTTFHYGYSTTMAITP